MTLLEFQILTLVKNQCRSIQELEDGITVPCSRDRLTEIVQQLEAAQKVTITPEGNVCRKT